jgi:CBS domain-containing protein
MTSPVVRVKPDATLYDAIEQMLKHKIGCVVVVDAGPVGILTRSDVLRTVYRSKASLSEQPVRHGMSEDPVTTTPGSAVKTTLATMEANGIKKLPVMEDLELVGIVTMTDIATQHAGRSREVRDSIEREDEWTD